MDVLDQQIEKFPRLDGGKFINDAVFPRILNTLGKHGGFLFQSDQGMRQRLRVIIQQPFEMCSIRSASCGRALSAVTPNAKPSNEGLTCGTSAGASVWKIGQFLFQKKDQELDFGGGGCPFEVEMNILDHAQNIGVAGDEHRGEGVQSRRKYRRRQQADDALHQFRFARQGKMIGRVVRLDEEQRSLNTQQAQLTPRFFAQQTANQQECRDFRLLNQELLDLFARDPFIGSEVFKKQIGDGSQRRQQFATVAQDARRRDLQVRR